MLNNVQLYKGEKIPAQQTSTNKKNKVYQHGNWQSNNQHAVTGHILTSQQILCQVKTFSTWSGVEIFNENKLYLKKIKY